MPSSTRVTQKHRVGLSSQRQARGLRFRSILDAAVLSSMTFIDEYMSMWLYATDGDYVWLQDINHYSKLFG
ncbi:hypothetical protein N7454_000726 [Penicillium verhagenii]|nr:hypothetical protein N7454_000726 [Penicillium verhagenii]